MAKKRRTEREDAILDLARETVEREGETEFDEDAIVSEGDDNGAYVQAWVWVPFVNTKLCADKAHEFCAVHCPAEEIE